MVLFFKMYYASELIIDDICKILFYLLIAWLLVYAHYIIYKKWKNITKISVRILNLHIKEC